MKKILVMGFVLISMFLSACGIISKQEKAPELVFESKGYREYLLDTPEDISFFGFEKAKELVTEKMVSNTVKYPIFLEFEYEPFESYNLEQPYLGGFKNAEHEYWIVESGRSYLEMSGKDHVWWEPEDAEQEGAIYEIYRDGLVYKNVTDIFSQPLAYGYDGFEGMINNIYVDDDTLAFEYNVIESVTSSVVEKDVFVNGETLNSTYGLLESKYFFKSQGHEVFIGTQQDGITYLFVDGVAVTEGFDSIPTTWCCASPAFFVDVYEDGTLFFIGVRDESYYLIEINVNNLSKKAS